MRTGLFEGYDDMGNETITIGCAGAGILGGAIMGRLIDCEFNVRVWNRTPEKVEPLTQAGGIAVDAPVELARGADFVIVCVTDGQAVEDVIFGDRGVAAAGSPDHDGPIVIDMSTIEAAHTRDLAQRLATQARMRWLDAPISGGAPAALEGRMAVMVGGDQATFEAASAVFDALAGRCTLMGPTGAGQTTKMINQVLVSCGMVVVAEACGLAERAGVDPGRVPAALAGGRADSALLQEFMPRMARSDFSPTGGMGVMAKDLKMIARLADAAGAPMPITSLVTEIYRKMILDGLAEHDNTELVRYFRPGD